MRLAGKKAIVTGAALPAEEGTPRGVPLGLAQRDGDIKAAGEPAFRGFPGQTDPDASDRAATILRVVRGRMASRFLDIGCGDGQLTSRVGGTVSAGEVHGVDLNPEMIQLAREKGVLAVPVDLDREPLPYPSNSFDLVLASEVIEHIYDPGSLLSEVHRVLTPGGKFIVTTPNLASWYNRLALFLGFQPWLTAASLHDPGAGKLNASKFLTKVGTIGGDHLRVLTLRALRDLAVAHGFTPAGFHVVPTTRLFDARAPFIMRIPLWLLQNTLGRFPALSSTLVVELVVDKGNERDGDG
jgi:methionine biosynthesis protein MetW